MKPTRRGLFGMMLAFGASALVRVRGEVGVMTTFSNRAHLYVRPEVKERLVSCLTSVFGCVGPASLNAPGLAEPILAFRFPGGGSISFEFRADALEEADARRAAWLEVKTDDVPRLQQAILDAGLTQLRHPATSTFYCVLPGGQVVGIVAA